MSGFESEFSPLFAISLNFKFCSYLCITFAKIFSGKLAITQYYDFILRDLERLMTASASAVTLSGGVNWEIPWPKLNMWPSNGCKSDLRAGAAAKSSNINLACTAICFGSENKINGSKLPCNANGLFRASNCFLARLNDIVQYSNNICANLSHIIQPNCTALSKHDDRNLLALMIARQ